MTYHRHERKDVMDEVVAVVGDHLPVSDHEDFDKTLLRDRTAPPSTTSTATAAAFIFSCKTETIK